MVLVSRGTARLEPRFLGASHQTSVPCGLWDFSFRASFASRRCHQLRASRKCPNVPYGLSRRSRPTRPQGKAGVGLCQRICLNSRGTPPNPHLANTHLPISCLEGQEDLLPLLVGATPQAVSDGLLISPWRKERWEWAGLGVVGMLCGYRLSGLGLPILLGIPTATPYPPSLPPPLGPGCLHPATPAHRATV